MKNKENQILNHVYWNKAPYGFTNMFSSMNDIEKSEQVSDNTVYVYMECRQKWLLSSVILVFSFGIALIMDVNPGSCWEYTKHPHFSIFFRQNI